MKKIILVSAMALSLAACSRVEPGHVGIKVSNFGSSAGVSDNALGVGWYMTGPGTSIEEYPVYTSTYVWRAGDSTNEEISFADKSGLGVTADVAVSYHVDPTKAPILYQTYRTDMQGIVDGQLRNVVRNAIVEQASTMAVEDIYSTGKSKLIATAQTKANEYFNKRGLIVDQLYWASNIRLPQTILSQINARVANEQQALAAQANVATVEANGRAAVAAAEARAKATEAEASALKASPEILRQRAIEKWDGKLPTYVGSGAPIPFIGGQ